MNQYIDADYTHQWDFDPPFFEGDTPRIYVELGSGIGVVAETLAKRAIRSELDVLYVTDLPDVCQLLQSSLSKCLQDNPDTVHVLPLSWGNEKDLQNLSLHMSGLKMGPQYFTHIICSDLVSHQSPMPTEPFK